MSRHCRIQYSRTPSCPWTYPPSIPLGQATSGCIVANAPSMSRALNAAYARIRRSRVASSGAAMVDRPPARRDLHLDAHAGIGEAGGDHRGRRTHVAEVLAENRPALREVRRVRNDVRDAHDIPHARPRLLEGGLDVPQALLGLLRHAVGDRHRLVVEPRGAGDEDPLAIDHGPRISDLLLERGP